MTSNRFAPLVPVALLAIFVAGCGNNHSSDSTAPVELSINCPQCPAFVDMSTQTNDLTIPSLTINSHAKSPTGLVGGQDDVILDLWVVTPQRSDGGTVASPQWRVSNTVDVPAGGTATLSNYEIFPVNYLSQPPLAQLFPQNGGVDKETGNCNIRQTLHIEIFGKTVSGKPISVAFDDAINFYYATPTCNTR